MLESQIAQGVQLLDLMLEYFSDDGHWARGRYDDGNGGHCLVGALLHLSRKHRLPRAPAIALLQDAMPRPGLALVRFNDTCCGGVAELRSIILKARRLADYHAEQERAAVALKSWLLAQIEKKRRAPSADIADTAPDAPFVPERLAAQRPQPIVAHRWLKGPGGSNPACSSAESDANLTSSRACAAKLQCFGNSFKSIGIKRLICSTR
jgi:hypothetical protein